MSQTPETTSWNVVSWSIVKKDDRYTYIQILENGTACLSNHRFDTKEAAEYWGNRNMWASAQTTGSEYIGYSYTTYSDYNSYSY